MADRTAGEVYFAANGWPTKLDGTLKVIGELDNGDLHAIAALYAKTLQTEFQSITIPEKRHAKVS